MLGPDLPAACQSCGAPVTRCLEFGPQPVSHRLPASPAELEFLHPLTVGVCQKCCLLQLIDPFPVASLRPAQPWRYTEPESHLDAVVAQLANRLPRDRKARIVGVSSKDLSTIDRLRQLGFDSPRCLDAAADWQARDSSVGMEWLQAQISDAGHPLHGRMRGQWDVVVARHLFEHAYDLRGFLKQLASWLAPGGMMLLEVPDFSPCLAGGDYAVFWEEHLVYYTARTLSRVLEQAGWEVLASDGYRYMPEDSLVVLARPRVGESNAPEWTESDSAGNDVLARFVAGFEESKRAWQARLDRERQAGGRVALLGAGHLGVTFVNLLNLVGSLDLIVDDDPAKRGRYLPKSHLPILGTDALADPQVRLCLMSVSPEGEERVLRQHRSWVERGGRLVSIFSNSRWAIR